MRLSRWWSFKNSLDRRRQNIKCQNWIVSAVQSDQHSWVESIRKSKRPRCRSAPWFIHNSLFIQEFPNYDVWWQKMQKFCSFTVFDQSWDYMPSQLHLSRSEDNNLQTFCRKEYLSVNLKLLQHPSWFVLLQGENQNSQCFDCSYINITITVYIVWVQAYSACISNLAILDLNLQMRCKNIVWMK